MTAIAEVCQCSPEALARAVQPERETRLFWDSDCGLSRLPGGGYFGYQGSLLAQINAWATAYLQWPRAIRLTAGTPNAIGEHGRCAWEIEDEEGARYLVGVTAFRAKQSV